MPGSIHDRRRRAACLALVVVAGALLVLLSREGSSDGHRVSAVVPEAVNAVPGQHVTAAGQRVGTIESVDLVRAGRAARISMSIDDDAWPLPQGSTMQLRWGGTISFSNRYVALRRGPVGGAPLPEGATLPTGALRTPVEFDELLATFTPEVRTDFKRMIDNAGPAFAAAHPPLRQSLESAPPALAQASSVVRDLSEDTRRLDTLVTAADRVVDGVHQADPGMRELLESGAQTFSVVAAESKGLRAALRHSPATFKQARKTLAQTDDTLGEINGLTDNLKPGVAELRRTVAPVNTVLVKVLQVAPQATGSLNAARRAAPDVNKLLARLTTRLPQVESISGQSVTALECIRPYTPEIVGFFSTWGDIFSSVDGKDKVIRANAEVPVVALTNASPTTPGEAAKLFPGLRYGFPRPPGYSAGQTWFLPQCGAGPDALDPSKDPEARNSEPSLPSP